MSCDLITVVAGSSSTQTHISWPKQVCHEVSQEMKLFFPAVIGYQDVLFMLSGGSPVWNAIMELTMKVRAFKSLNRVTRVKRMQVLSPV